MRGEQSDFWKFFINILIITTANNIIEISMLERLVFMGLPEKVLADFEKLSDARKNEVVDFIEYLRNKEERELELLMDQGIIDNIEALRELAK